jgi:hypothetical protein
MALRSDCHHVLTGSVACRVLEMQINVIAFNRHAHVEQLAVSRCRFGHGAQLIDVRHDPRHKGADFLQIRKGEARHATDALVEQHRGAATGFADKLRASVVRRDERRFGRRQRHHIIAVREKAVYTKRPGNADWNLDRADKVLNVVGVTIGVGYGLRVAQSIALCRRCGQQSPALFDSVVGWRVRRRALAALRRR